MYSSEDMVSRYLGVYGLVVGSKDQGARVLSNRTIKIQFVFDLFLKYLQYLLNLLKINEKKLYFVLMKTIKRFLY